ncbi:ABC transporter substrate-binding protein [Lacrimispora sp.]|uniref:ABC transporter substrate-binding protein n=1 Tax=Lacrimispora sp. TaxID=2719234 RepID=UPI0029E49968|nr:raffinose/stachyose/melibiose transport system substrate-binding protein [Lacrimispora sp.]
MKVKKLVSLGLVFSMALSLAACGGAEKSSQTEAQLSADVPTIDSIKLGEDYLDIKASVKVLTNRTDIADTVYKGYAEKFMKLYPGIEVTYEGVTDYSQSMNLRLPTGDWGDICYIPTSVDKDEFSQYFTPFGDYKTLDTIYNFLADKNYAGKQYGIPNGGTVGGVVYNKKVWEKAGITEMPKTPEEFLTCMLKIKDNTDAVPLYTNFAAGWTMGAWDQYIGIPATGDSDYLNNKIAHIKDPFAKRDDMTGPYAVYNVLYEAVKRGLVEEDPASSDWESSKGMMNKGEIGTMVLGSWAVEQCKAAGSSPEDVAYMPFPISINGKQYANTIGGYSYCINKETPKENQIAAMIYVKWLLEESSIFTDEGTIPALKSKPLPDVLSDFGDVELLTDNAAIEGEETLLLDVSNESEVGINNNDYKVCEILESALYGTKDLDTIMNEWNEKWSQAQETLDVKIIDNGQ